jgi:hypothetical protein
LSPDNDYNGKPGRTFNFSRHRFCYDPDAMMNFPLGEISLASQSGAGDIVKKTS